jgi:uncharacterized protein (TIGR03435 family)
MLAAGQGALEVASVKPNPNDVPEAIALQPTGIRITGFHLRTLIRITYGPGADIQTYDQIVGGPDWLATDRFDIVAKTDQRLVPGADGQRPELVPAVLQQVLEDRFRLKVHVEQRSRDVFALRFAREGRLGPQLRVSTVTCPTYIVGAPPQAQDPQRWCGFRNLAGVIAAQRVSIAQLGAVLAGYPDIGRPVVDRTGLTGNDDLRVEFPDTGPSLITALREQLGLALQSDRAAVPFIVVDHAEHPTPD